MYKVIELRRYITTPTGRSQFARYFETWFPEAFQQLGASVLGHFYERGRNDRFTWLRGYKDMDARGVVNGAFYFGPVWKEHKLKLNNLLIDNDDVLLLRPLYPDSDIAALRAVDPLAESEGAQGIVVLQLLPMAQGKVEACVQTAEEHFANYHGRGVIEAGILTTLDRPNNFPQHPVRTDGPWLAWVGVLRDEAALESVQGALTNTAEDLQAKDLLSGPAELLVLDPCPRSRLRWIPVIEHLNQRSAA